jgi:hypothetical protein
MKNLSTSKNRSTLTLVRRTMAKTRIATTQTPTQRQAPVNPALLKSQTHRSRMVLVALRQDLPHKVNGKPDTARLHGVTLLPAAISIM